MNATPLPFQSISTEIRMAVLPFLASQANCECSKAVERLPCDSCLQSGVEARCVPIVADLHWPRNVSGNMRLIAGSAQRKVNNYDNGFNDDL